MANCGLITGMNQPVPLKSVEVDVKVQGHVATVSSTLLYVNGEERPLEAVFVFPLPGECALCRFSAKIGDTEVVAKLQEKQKAREDYDDALSSGHQAFLLEESLQSPDIFQLDVGNLPPAGSAAITLVYISELAMQADDALRFCLPVVLNPRYTPPGMDRNNMATVTSVPARVANSLGKKCGIPYFKGRLATPVPADTVPYTLALRAHLSSPLPISKVESNCSLEPLEYLNRDKTEAKVCLSSGHMFDRDVELLLYYEDAHKPTAIVEAGQPSAEQGSLMHDPVVMLSCYPEFPAAAISSLDLRGEFIFLMDQSGSMDEKMHSGSAVTRLDNAKDTLLLLLKSLPPGCYFNIYGFGSRFTHLFPDSIKYTEKTMDYAVERVKALRANLGFTEILEPLQHIYSQPCHPKHPRQLFTFTDGEVKNTKDVLDLVKVHASSHRCFSFGIGEGASTALITGLAKEGCGHAQFITGSDRMQPKVMQSLRYALQPTVKDISVEWNLPDGMSVTSLSPPLKVLFHGQRALLYAQLKGESNGHAEGSVTIQYSLMRDTVKNSLSFCLKPTGDTGETLHQLGARALIRSLEMEERDVGAPSGSQNAPVREKLLQLSLQSGVSCSHTAFIAVHKATGQAVHGPLLRRTVPTPGLSQDTYAIARKATGQTVQGSLPCRTVPTSGWRQDTLHAIARKATGQMVQGAQPHRTVPTLRWSQDIPDMYALSSMCDDDDDDDDDDTGLMVRSSTLGCSQDIYVSVGKDTYQQDIYVSVGKDTYQQDTYAAVRKDTYRQDNYTCLSRRYDSVQMVDGTPTPGQTTKKDTKAGWSSVLMKPLSWLRRRGTAAEPEVYTYGACASARKAEFTEYQALYQAPERSLVAAEYAVANKQTNSPTLSSLGRSHNPLGGEPHQDPLLQLVSLQKASGCWDMDSCLAQVLGKTDAELAKNMPKGVDNAVWATVVALMWLYGFQLTARDEWTLVGMKGASWIQTQRVSCVPECVQAGNALLGCQVQQETLCL